jgi:hypothetical protein
MYNMVLYLCVLIVFLLRRESLKLILATDPLPRWFCHNHGGGIHSVNTGSSFLTSTSLLFDLDFSHHASSAHPIEGFLLLLRPVDI